MKKLFLCIIIAFMAINLGLYAQEKETVQVEPEIKLELVWEKEIPTSIKDNWPYPRNFVFLDENGYNVFSIKCKDPEKALENKLILMLQDRKLRFFEGEEMKLSNETELNGEYAISKNGHNIAVIEGLERHIKGVFVDKSAILRLFNWKGEELASTKIRLGGWEHIDLYPLGNDRTIIIDMAGGEGLYHGIKIFVKNGELLTEVFSNEENSWFVDYAENGECALFVIKNKEKVLYNDIGEEQCRYICPHPFRRGYLSSKGNYIAEITAGKYIVILDRNGQLIKEHKVQGLGDYYAAFSSDEEYLCVTPGPWRLYFFKTKTGRMIWEYLDTYDESHFSSIAVSPTRLVFAGHSEAILKPQEFEGTIEELNRKVAENATKDRTIYMIKDGKFVQNLRSFPGKGFGTQLQSPIIQLSKDGRFLLVQTPSKTCIYRVRIGGD